MASRQAKWLCNDTKKKVLISSSLAPAPIILFVYNRPWHTRQTVEALQKCEQASRSDLYIFADGPKENASEEVQQKIAEVRQYIHTIDGFKSIHIQESPANKGLANSVIQGVSDVINRHGKVIVVEDDIVAHPFFLRFMNEALERYENTKQIFAISATMERFRVPSNYKKDVFLTYRFGSWGWATWTDRWNSVDWAIDNYPLIKHPTSNSIKQFCKGGDDLWPMLKAQKNSKIDSWAIRMGYYMSLQKRFCLRSIHSFVNNIGMDNSGTHCGESLVNLLPLYDEKNYDICFPEKISVKTSITENIQSVFRQEKERISAFKWVKRRIKRILINLHLWKA